MNRLQRTFFILQQQEGKKDGIVKRLRNYTNYVTDESGTVIDINTVTLIISSLIEKLLWGTDCV